MKLSSPESQEPAELASNTNNNDLEELADI